MAEYTPRLLNIYGPHAWHDDATIAGNRAALERLRDAIGTALIQGGAGFGAYTSGDGEGFAALVICLPDDDDHYTLVPPIEVPYSADYAHGGQGNKAAYWETPQHIKARESAAANQRADDIAEDAEDAASRAEDPRA